LLPTFHLSDRSLTLSAPGRFQQTAIPDAVTWRSAFNNASLALPVALRARIPETDQPVPNLAKSVNQFLILAIAPNTIHSSRELLARRLAPCTTGCFYCVQTGIGAVHQSDNSTHPVVGRATGIGSENTSMPQC